MRYNSNSKFFSLWLAAIIIIGFGLPAVADVPILTFNGNAGNVNSVAFSPDGTKILTGYDDSTVKLWDANTGALIRNFSGHTALVYSVKFSPDGTKILSGGRDWTAKLWDISTGQTIRTFSWHNNWIVSVDYSPDGTKVVTCSTDMTAKLGDVNTGQLIRTFSGHSNYLCAVLFSPDGSKVLTGSDDRTAKLWDANTGQEIRTFSGHSDWVGSLAFSLDGTKILTGSADHTAKLWNTNTGQLIRTFTEPNIVRSVAFSPDGTKVLTGGSDQISKLWDISTGQLVHTYSGHTTYVLSVAFSPDGSKILTGGGDGLAKLWDINLPLKITSPNGGEVWQPGIMKNIVYSATSSITSVSLALSLNAGATWNSITASTPASGTYAWSIPYASSTQCLIAVGDAASATTCDISDNCFTIQLPLFYILDNFNDGAINSTYWTTLGSVSESGGVLTTTGRGYLVTRDQFDPSPSNPIRIEFDWLMQTYNELGGTAIVYTRADGTNAAPYNEAQNGLGCTFYVENDNSVIKTSGFVEQNGATQTFANGQIAKPSGSYAHLLITDDGTNVTFSVNGTQVWVFSNGFNPLTNFIQLSGGEGNSGQFDNYRIWGTPSIQTRLVSPNGGEVWHSGTTHDIVCSASPTISSVTLEYSINAGTSWNTIVTFYPTASLPYSWQIPDVSSNQCLIKASYGNNNYANNNFDVSDNNFTINPAQLKILSPNGGEVCQAGTHNSIVYAATGIASVSISYSVDAGVSWIPLSASTAANGAYTWFLPDVSSTTCLVKIANASDGVAIDESDGYFSIKPRYIYAMAGNGTYGYSGDGGLATSATLGNQPDGVCADAAGNLYIADMYNNRIRMVNPSGIITTVAGNGTYGYSGDGGPATSASFKNPSGVFVEAMGNLYIADSYNSRIRMVNLSGIITTIAGNGTWGYSGDGGPAVSASLYIPDGICVDATGNLYIADYYNNRIRMVNPSGIITTVAGNGTSGNSGDGGPATSASLSRPTSVCVDASGNLYIADSHNSRIRMVNLSGIITTIAGNGTWGYSGDGGPAVSASLYIPNGICMDATGNLYISTNNRIRMVNACGIITNIAGTGVGGYIDAYNGDGGPAINALLYFPQGICLNPAGNLYISDIHSIRKMTYESLSLQIVSPNGGETWQAGTTHNIAYSAKNYYSVIASVSMSYSIDNGTSWNLIAAPVLLSGSYSWTIPNTPSTACMVKISSVTDDSIIDVSDNNFTISSSFDNPTLTLEPTNINVYRGQEVEIAARVSDASGIVGYRLALDYDPSKITYVPGSATKMGTLTESGWYSLIVNNATASNQLIFTCASAGSSLPSVSGALMKFRLLVNSALPDFTTMTVSYNASLTSLNEDAIAVDLQSWNATVLGANHAPYFTKGPDQTVSEDCGPQAVINWATNIAAGPAYESYQALTFIMETNNPSLFSATPAVSATGTLTYTPALNANGVAWVTATLHDDGGVANGGVDSSTPQTFVITVDAVNDAPTLAAISNPLPIYEDSGVQSVTLASIGDGDPEIVQPLIVSATSSNLSLIPSVTVAYASPNDYGSLLYASALNANGSATITVTVTDTGGGAPPNVNMVTRSFIVTVIPVNDEPTMNAISDPAAILEDATEQTVLLSGIGDGDPELSQILILSASSSAPALIPSVTVEYTSPQSTATLRYKPLPNANGVAVIMLKLQDDGGAAPPDDNVLYRNFNVTVTPVNDAPSFIAGATVEVLNATAGFTHTFVNWATAISAGPPDEASQTRTFLTLNDQNILFASQPVINATGTLTFTPAAGAHGVVNVSTSLYDNGGLANGGVNSSATATFKIVMQVPYLWGDLNDNLIVGSVDAYLLLQYDISLIDSFPGYPPAQYPEYVYPINPLGFPPAADVNWDGEAGTWDASLVLQYYALLLPHFPADTNQNDWGPDEHQSGKAASRGRGNAGRTLSAIAAPNGDSWTLTFSIDEAAELCGLRLALRYDPESLEVDEDNVNWLNPEAGLLLTNEQNPGLLLIGGALSQPMAGGASALITVPMKRKSAEAKALWIGVDSTLTRLNDGQLPLAPNSAKFINLSGDTNVQDWMLH
ncbi:MAG: cohesin domain-containing protein [Candidatus Omnitrophota bacterium]